MTDRARVPAFTPVPRTSPPQNRPWSCLSQKMRFNIKFETRSNTLTLGIPDTQKVRKVKFEGILGNTLGYDRVIVTYWDGDYRVKVPISKDGSKQDLVLLPGRYEIRFPGYTVVGCGHRNDTVVVVLQ